MKKILEIINKCELVIAMVCVTSFTLIVFLGAVCRLMGYPLNWSMDMAMFLLAWTTFLGGDIAFRAGKLVNVGIFVERFPKNFQKVIAVLVYLILASFMILMIINGIKLCQTTVNRTFNGIPGFSYMWVTLSIPISFSFMILTAIDRIMGILKTQDIERISKM